MCFECWFNCLDNMQQAMLIIMPIGLYIHIGARLVMRYPPIRVLLEKIDEIPDPFTAHLAFAASNGIVFISCLVVYSLYGAVSCLL